MINPGIIDSYISGSSGSSAVVIAHSGSPFFSVYTLPNWTKLSDPSVLPTNMGSNRPGAKPDGSEFIVCGGGSPYAYRYDYPGLVNQTDEFSLTGASLATYSPSNSFIAIIEGSLSVEVFNVSDFSAETSITPTNFTSIYDAKFSNDDSILAVTGAGASGTKLALYDTSDWSLITGPGDVGNFCRDCAWSHDDAWLGIAVQGSPYFLVYDTSDWSLVSTPVSNGSVFNTGAAFNHNSSLFATGITLSPYIEIYDTSTWTKLSDPSTSPTGEPQDCQFSSDGSILSIAHFVSPYITNYNTSDWSKIANPSTLPPGTGRGIAFI